MAKPLVIVKRSAPQWTVHYTDIDTDVAHNLKVIGSPTIDDAILEAKQSLNATHLDWYRITKVTLDDPHDQSDHPDT